MSDSSTASRLTGVRLVGLFSIIAGIVLIVAGAVTWVVVTSELKEQKITVSEDADMFGGRTVAGPFTAYAQAEVINKHAMEATDGKTYAQLEQDDPLRTTAMNASFLRASLYTSVVAYGVALLVIGLGIMFALLGWAFMSLAPAKATDAPAQASADEAAAA